MLRRIDSAFFASSKSAKKKPSIGTALPSPSSAGNTAASAVALASAAATAAASHAPFPASLPDSSRGSSSSNTEGGAGDASSDSSEVLVVNAVAVPANSANHTIVFNPGGGGGGSWAERQKVRVCVFCSESTLLQ